MASVTELSCRDSDWSTKRHKPPLSHSSSYSGRKPPVKPPGTRHHSINPIQRHASWGKRSTRAAALSHLTRLGSNACLLLRHPRDFRSPSMVLGSWEKHRNTINERAVRSWEDTHHADMTLHRVGRLVITPRCEITEKPGHYG